MSAGPKQTAAAPRPRRSRRAHSRPHRARRHHAPRQHRRHRARDEDDGTRATGARAPAGAFRSDEATARAAGADDMLARARVARDARRARSPTAASWSAPPRACARIALPIVDPREARRADLAARCRANRVAVLFGREQTGLTNDELARCQQLVHIPANPEFGSLNSRWRCRWSATSCGWRRHRPPPAARERAPLATAARARRLARAPRAPAHESGFLHPAHRSR